MTKIKNKIIVALSALLVFCLAFSLAMATPTTTKATDENAVTPTVNVQTILMDEGASVRTETTNGIDSGIRFTMYINADYYASLTNPVVGMYIARATDATEDDMKTGTLPEKYQHFVAQAFADDAVETVEDTKSFNAVIFNIPEEEFATALIANGYIVADGVEIEYAVNPQTRSIAQVASKALANGMDDEVLFDYVDKAVELSGETLAFATETATLDRYLDEGASANLGLTVPGNFTAIVSSSDPEVATVDANGVVTRGTKVGTATITAQLGSIEVTATVTVTAEKPEIYTVDENYNKEIYLFDGASYFGDYDSTGESANFAGGYTGDAVVIKWANVATGYSVKNNYSLTELNAIAEDYSAVTFWIASTGTYNNGLVSFEANDSKRGGASVTNKLDMLQPKGWQFKATENGNTFGINKWYKIILPIADYIDLVTNDDGTVKDACHITTLWAYGDTQVNTIKMYFGDISFENPPISIVTVNQSNYNSVIWNADVRPAYVSAADLTVAGITGEYTGNAVRFATTNNPGYKIINNYSIDELNDIAKKYDVISLWIAVGGYESGTLGIYDIKDPSQGRDAFVTTALGGQGHFTSLGLVNNTWKKISISIEEYIDLLVSVENGDWGKGGYTSYCPLYRIWTNGINKNSETKAYVYIGDIFFE